MNRVEEAWIRSLGIHIAAAASFGHMVSLQGSASIMHALLTFSCYAMFPEIPLAQVLIRTLLMVTRICWKREQIPFRYFIAACLGLHAVSSSSSRIPLVSLRPNQVDRASPQIGILWIGRFGLLLAFLAQYLGSAFIWIRLVFYVQDRGFWMWNIDIRNFEMIFGGFVATINSLLILSVGSEWKLLDHVDTGSISDSCQIPKTPSDVSLAEKSLSVKLEEQVAGGHTPTDNAREDTDQRETIVRHEGVVSFIERLRMFNRSFSEFLDGCFPGLLQSDLELAVLLHRTFTYGIAVYTFQHRFSGGCPPILHFLTEASSTFNWTQICPDRTDIWDPTTVTQYPRQRKYTRHVEFLRISGVLFNMGVARILGNWLFSIVVMSSKAIGKPLPRQVRSFKQWVFSGRSIMSFPLVPLLFACGPVWIMCQLEQTGWTIHAQSVLQSRAENDIDRMALNVLMWKDPWQDTLYLI